MITYVLTSTVNRFDIKKKPQTCTGTIQIVTKRKETDVSAFLLPMVDLFKEIYFLSNTETNSTNK